MVCWLVCCWGGIFDDKIYFEVVFVVEMLEIEFEVFLFLNVDFVFDFCCNLEMELVDILGIVGWKVEVEEMVL